MNSKIEARADTFFTVIASFFNTDNTRYTLYMLTLSKQYFHQSLKIRKQKIKK